MTQDNQTREHWSSPIGFVLAAAGSAIGLGNIWKFPYITGQNGGGAFVLIYLLCITLVGLPVMLCELVLGRKTQRNPVGAFKMLSPQNSVLAHILGGILLFIGIALICFQSYGWGGVICVLGLLVFRFGWVVVGGLGVVSGFIILSYYSVVAGWTLEYILGAITGNIHQLTDVKTSQQYFGNFIVQNVGKVIFWHFVFMLCCIAIVIMGVKKGIERASDILMPLLFFLLLVLILRSITLPGAIQGISFLCTPDFTKLTPKAVLIALGHAFFTLSLGMGAMITYGSYLSKEDNIFLSGLSIVFLDTLVAILAGFAIFPAVFAMGFEPGAGPGLLFEVLPVVFNRMPGGVFWAGCFFFFVFIAALTSGISLLEVVTAYFVDEWRMSRKVTTVLFGFIIFLLGIPSALSIANWDRLPRLYELLGAIFGKSRLPGCFFDVVDHLVSNWLLPLGGMFIALFVGWIWGTKNAVDEIRHGSQNFADVHFFSLLAGLKDDPSHNSPIHVWTLASMWGFCIRFLSPLAVLIAFLHIIEVIKL